MKNKKDEIIVSSLDPATGSGQKHVIQKMLDDKRDINAYFNGNISLTELQAKGIKLVKAL